MKVKILEGMEVEEILDMSQIAHIDKDNLSDEFLKQAGKYVWYATLLALAIKRRDEAKLSLEIVEAELDALIRKNAVQKNEKITEAFIRGAVVRLDEYQNAVKFFIKVKEDAEILMAVTKSFEQRKDMLIAFGSLIKHEMSAGINIMEKKLK